MGTHSIRKKAALGSAAAAVIVAGAWFWHAQTHGYPHESMERELAKRLQLISEMFEQHPRDAELRMGAGELFRAVGELGNNPLGGSFTQCEAAVELAPANVAARAVFLRHTFYAAVQQLGQYQKELASPSKHRREAAVRRGIFKEASWLMEQIETAKAHDPDNALYNYLVAGLYFVQQQPDRAITEIEEGSRKDSIRLYTKEAVEARAKLLRKIDMPWPEQGFFLVSCSCPGSYPRKYVLPCLEQAATQYAQAGDFEKQRDVLERIVRIGEQYAEDAFCSCEKIDGYSISLKGYDLLTAAYEGGNSHEKATIYAEKARGSRAERDRVIGLLDKYQRFDQWFRRRQFRAFVGEAVVEGEIQALEDL